MDANAESCPLNCQRRVRVVSSRSKQASLRLSDSQADFQNKSNQKWPESGFEDIWL